MAQVVIQIADNSKKQLVDCVSGTFTDIHKSQLQEIAGVPIKNIKLEDSPRLLVFPQCLTECKDKIQDSPIFSFEDDKVLCSNNILGFIGYKDIRIRIHSRFAKDDEQDFFLHYMLQKVFAVNLFFISNIPPTKQRFLIF